MSRLTRPGRVSGTRAEVSTVTCSMRPGLAPRIVAMKGAVTPVETPLSRSTDRAIPGASQAVIAHSRTGRAKSLTAQITPTSRASAGCRRARVAEIHPQEAQEELGHQHVYGPGREQEPELRPRHPGGQAAEGQDQEHDVSNAHRPVVSSPYGCSIATFSHW